MKVYIPRDASARALGADAVAKEMSKHAQKHSLEIIRNGSRGMSWLEPLIEVERGGIRYAYGPAGVEDVVAILDNTSPKALGPTDDLPWMQAQTRLTFARVGVIDPLSLNDYRRHGGMQGLKKAIEMTQNQMIDEVIESGLRGRGGAGFPTGIKWRTVAHETAPEKYIICNADEGDSGTFADRMLMEGDPFCLIEGMIIAGLATGAQHGLIYIRSEYPDAIHTMQLAIEVARKEGILGTPFSYGTHNDDFSFDIDVRVGAGAYICGEETSLLNSLEGKRGVVRSKPPLPAISGFMSCPSVVNNVISLATAPVIFAKGAKYYQGFGLGKSRGTVALQIAGNAKYGGLFECAFGITLGEVVHGLAGGSATRRPVKAVQIGGPLGAYFPPSLFDTPLGYEEFADNDGLIGHAGIVIFDESVDMLEQARFAMEFCAIESCGKCTPCRIGSIRGVETLDRLAQGAPDAMAILLDLCETMKSTSLCALGGFTPYPVLSAITHFPDDFKVSTPQEEAL